MFVRILVLMAIAACGKGKENTQSAAKTQSQSGRNAAATIRFDGKDLREVSASEISSQAALTSVLPAQAKSAQWNYVVATNGTNRVQLRDVSTKYADQELRFYVDKSGQLGFGAFRDPAPDAPAHIQRKLRDPTIGVTNVTLVEIYSEVPSAAADEWLSQAPPLAVRWQERQTTLTTPDFQALPPLNYEISEKQLRRSLGVHDLIRASLPDASYNSATFSTSEGDPLEVSASNLASEASLYVLSLNRKGQWNLKVVSSNNPPQVVLRDVSEILLH